MVSMGPGILSSCQAWCLFQAWYLLIPQTFSQLLYRVFARELTRYGHGLDEFMKATPCEVRLYRKEAGKSNGRRGRAGEGVQKVNDSPVVRLGVRDQDAVAAAHEGEQ